MSGNQMVLLGGTAAATPVDPYFYSVTSLLHGDGTNGGQNNTFLDSSSNNFTITRNGNTTQGSFSPFSQTGWSNYFDGTGDYLSMSDAGLAIGNGDFTLECWVYCTTTPSDKSIFEGRSGGTGTTGFTLTAFTGTTVRIFSGSALITSGTINYVNTWCHIAVSRVSGTTTLYVNGISQGTTTSLGNLTDSSFLIGAGKYASPPTVDAFFTGYISNFRIVKGTAVYTANFTPPTAPLTAITNTSLLTCQSNRFRDASTNNFTITRNGDVSVQPFSPFNPTTAYSASSIGGSGYFDGSGDSLTSTWSVIGSNQFTCEAWVYITEGSNRKYIVGPGVDTATHYDGFGFEIQGQTLNMWASSDGTSWNLVTSDTSQGRSANAVPLNSWNHVVMTRDSSGVFRSFINGKLECVVSPGTAALADASTTVLNLGRARYTGDFANFLGYISNFRIVNGSVVSGYSTSSTTVGTQIFTPPTTPLTAITNTSFLCNFTNGAIFDNAAVADYETVGNAQISTSVKKYGTGSLAFDGAGDYIVAAQTQPLAPGTGDFCYELWLYLNSTGTACVFDTRTVNNNTTGFTLLVNGSAQLALYTNTTILTCSATLSASIWYHVAVTRTAGNIKVFLNGTQIGTLANTSNFSDKSFRVGQYVDGTGSLNGYVDDVRISNGISRYSYNFTPPTAEFPNIGGTVTLTADPYFEYTTLLLPGNGTNGAQNNTFLDSSTNAFTITRNGNTTQGTFSPFSQTGWGNYFDGTGDYLTVADNTALDVEASDFTVELWYFPTATPSTTVGWFSKRANDSTYGGVYGFFASSLAPGILATVNGSSWGVNITSSISCSANQWNHLAIVRSGSTWSLYVNGVLGASATLAGTVPNNSAALAVGAGAENGALPINASYISNFRLVKGTAVYTANFTPPTAALTAITNTSLLTCQSNRFIDNSTNAFAITRNGDVSVQAFSPFNPTASWSAATYGGSGYFDGSGDYLTLPTAAESDLNLTGTFTFECWFYCSTSGDMWFFSKGGGTNDWNSTNGIAYQFMIESGSVKAQFNTGGSFLTISATAPASASWNHFAIGRNGTTLRAWLNGASMGTSTTSISPPTTRNIIKVGANTVNGSTMNGYLAGMIAVNGTDVYGVGNTTITVPTAPPTAITNTKFLANFTNAGIYDATSKNDLETVGNAQISTTQSKFGGSSMYFDGAGDYLVGPWNPLTDLGAGDFTIEFWIYPTAVGQSLTTYLFYIGTSGNYAPILIGQAASGYGIVLYSSSTGSSWNLASGSSFGTATANAWNHVALTRYGADVRLFLNGAVGTTLNWGTTALLTGSSHKPNIGSATGVANTYYTGYMQDLRVTKGIARYTSNFTPPTTAFLTL